MACVAAATPGAAHADAGGDGVDVAELARGEFVVDAARGFGFEGLRERALRARGGALFGSLGEHGGHRGGFLGGGGWGGWAAG